MALIVVSEFAFIILLLISKNLLSIFSFYFHILLSWDFSLTSSFIAKDKKTHETHQGGKVFTYSCFSELNFRASQKIELSYQHCWNWRTPGDAWSQMVRLDLNRKLLKWPETYRRGRSLQIKYNQARANSPQKSSV